MLLRPPRSTLVPYTTLFGSQEFVPLAEESPLITEVGRWVLHEACRTVGSTTDDELSVAVNVSARQVRRSEEHTSELQSRQYLVCRLLLEKKTSSSFL